ncbi:MAG: hypothetical protein KA205_06095 [Acidobacteria bacterium]|nr:hypothetical protein [Acidobacteriota bacterium]
MSRARLSLIALLLAPLAVASAACDNGPTTPDTTTTTTTPVTSPVTETFSSQLAMSGFSARSFTAAKPGSASVTLASVGSSSTLKVGLGIGIPDSLGSGCLFTRSIETAAGGSVTANVDAGTYCVRVYDIGTLTSTVNFTATIIRP